MLHSLAVKTTSRCQLLDVTAQVGSLIGRYGIENGAALIYVPHTTAAVTINENADPSVTADILAYTEKLIPQSAGFRHSEGNSDAHIKSSLFGASLLVPIEGGRLALGTWQGIYFAEFDGPRNRKMYVKFLQELS